MDEDTSVILEYKFKNIYEVLLLERKFYGE